ncbi:DUF732 domain-containing protein [Mycolicibacterium hodleri]|uniref:DUF732 domain-containing protein n=1 Tax=Mycolicibacterium hodleri TaxID=49897 RepID=A0A502E361_9MYCO|nr:DUF732 domain-containing protein [Mycolicibacterium hodleri]TPG31754.1 DUF732 domain-containing protein [Mycolicibacterium hodleri]
MGRFIYGVLLAAALAFAPIAHADPTQDYLNQLSGTVGFTVTPFTSMFLTNAGNAICADLRAGVSPEDAAQRQLSYPGSTIALTRLMVSAAHQNICPDVP